MICREKLVDRNQANRGHRLTLAIKLSDTGAPTLQALSTPSSVGLKPQTVVDEDIVDVKQIDRVLSELAAMSGRWNLFRKFLFDRLSVIYHPLFLTSLISINLLQDHESDSEGGELNGDGLAEIEGEQNTPKIPEEFQIIESCQSGQFFQKLLEAYYIPLEVWYTRSIIDKVTLHFSR